MFLARKRVLYLVMAGLLLCLTGCVSDGISFNENMQIEYENNNRLDKYYELVERYDNTRAVTYLNKEEDCWWITNFTIWFICLILPDLPTIVATGGILGTFYGIAWCLGITLAGGGILATLAVIGAFFGVLPGIPPSIMGIVYFGVMFGFISNLVRSLL